MVYKNIGLNIMALISMYASNAFAASNFNLVPFGELPTSITVGQTVSANFTLTNNTHSARSNYMIAGLPKNVIQNKSGLNCSNPINLSAQGSCNLRFDITGAASPEIAICKNNSCTSLGKPFNVSLTNNPPSTPSRIAYVTQYVQPPLVASNAVVRCEINQTDGLLENCLPADNSGVLSNVYPQGLTINKQTNTAYLTSINYQNPIAYQCTINSSTGLFDTCTGSTVTVPSGYSPYYGMLTLNSSGTHAYLADYFGNGGRILNCPISNNAIQSNCTDTGAVVTSYVVGLTLDSANNTAYIGNYDYAYLTTCTVTNGVMSNCANKTGAGTVNFSSSGPTSTVINNTGTILYITDYGQGTIYGCDTTSPTNSTVFNSCFIAAQNISSPWDITLNATGTFAYITDYSSRVYVCPIKSDGSFDTCAVNDTFISPVAITLM